ncbi:MAG: HlyD family efflux transporter periplasmic adaptor subunit [Pseudomonadota bacterium]
MKQTALSGPASFRAAGRSMGRYTLIGVVACVLLVGGLGGWAATARISSAVVAPGVVVAQNGLVAVYSPTGGAVRQFFVAEGETLAEGAPLLSLDGTPVVAPVAGRIAEILVKDAGSPVRAGQVLARLLPAAAPMVVEARVSPADIDEVAIGQPVRVSFATLDARTAAPATGRVISRGVVAQTDPRTGITHFKITVALDDGAMGEDLLPGVPAEVFVTTGGQSAAAYLLRPILDQIGRAWREG